MNKNFKKLIAAGALLCGILVGFSLSKNASNQDQSAMEEKNFSASKDSDVSKGKMQKSESIPQELKVASGEQKSGVKWYSYDEGISMGKDKKKKIFLSFYADWCGYCKQMEKTTFADKSVVSYMNENFVSIRINADKELKLTSTYNVRGLPDTWFLSENGEQIGSQPGYIAPDTMLPLLKYIYSDKYQKMSFDKFMKGM